MTESRGDEGDDGAVSQSDQCTSGIDQTVYVLVSRKMDSPHPFCEAVYDNKKAAREHKKELADSIDVVAWDVHERPVRTGIDRNGGDRHD